MICSINKLNLKPARETIARYFTEARRLTPSSWWSSIYDRGSFHFPTNEDIRMVPPQMKELAYLGCGLEQNFTYIAHGNFKVAYIGDIRPQNIKIVLPLLAMFSIAAETRAQWLSLLLGVPIKEEAEPQLNLMNAKTIHFQLVTIGPNAEYQERIVNTIAQVLAPHFESSQDLIVKAVDNQLKGMRKQFLSLPLNADIMQFLEEPSWFGIPEDKGFHLIRNYWIAGRIRGLICNFNDLPDELFEDIKREDSALGLVYISILSDFQHLIARKAKSFFGKFPRFIIAYESSSYDPAGVLTELTQKTADSF